MVGEFFVKCTKWPFFLYWAWPWHRQDTVNISSSPTTTAYAKQRKSWFKPHSALKWNLHARIVVSSCQLNKVQKQKSSPILNCWSNLYWPTNLSSKSTLPYPWWYWWKWKVELRQFSFLLAAYNAVTFTLVLLRLHWNQRKQPCCLSTGQLEHSHHRENKK